MAGFRALIAAALALAALPAFAGEGAERTIHVPEGWEGAYEFGYAPVVRVGDTVIVSGVPASGDGSYEDKVRGMYTRIGELLASAGATFDDVVELTTFHTTSSDSPEFREEFERYMPIHREFFGEHRPAWTAVGTTVLLSGTGVVEMRVVAEVGSGAASRVIWGAAAGTDPVAVTERFAFSSDPEINLHHFLYQWAGGSPEPIEGRWPVPVPEREELGELAPDERAAWTAAVEHYRERVAPRDVLFDDEMVALRDHLAGLVPAPEGEWAEATLAALERARPVYEAHWWPRHDEANRRWVAKLLRALRRVEVGVTERMAAAFGGSWPEGLVRVDVSGYSGDLGAYTTGSVAGPGPQVTITSLDESYAMPHALEMVFHEAGHVDLLMNPLSGAIRAAFAEIEAETPRRLWHQYLFVTAGELTRQAYGDLGMETYEPYIEAFGLVDRRGVSAAYEALDAHWLPYLRGDLADETLRGQALAAVARALAISPSS